MFYTKYRPKNFTEISKPNDVAEALVNQVLSAKVGHAYLFVGSRGTGKTTTARILAKALNCQKLEKSGDPCNECENCKHINKASFPDLIEIDAASNRGIDDIRELKSKINLAPTFGKSKVYIIDEVHMLTTEAFNALLKTLEEPPERVVFILCTTEEHKIPDTVKSRCQVFKFKKATIPQIIKKLEEILKQEGVESLTKEDLKKIAQSASGGFRDAETLLQQVVEGNLSVSSFVGLNSQEQYHALTTALIERDAKKALSLFHKSLDIGIDVSVWCYDYLLYLRNLLFFSVLLSPDSVDKDDEDIMKDNARALGTNNLAYLTELFLNASEKLAQSVIPQLPVEIAITTYCSNNTSLSMQNTEYTRDSGPSNTSKAGNQIQKSGSNNKKDKLETSINAAQMEDISDKMSYNSVCIEINTEELATKWKEVSKLVLKQNSSIHALIKNSVPIAISGNYLMLEVLYSFHKDRMESPKNRKLIEGILEEIFGVSLAIKCEVNEAKRLKKSTGKEVGELTDKNVSMPVFSTSPQVLPENLNDFFDGGLPL